MTDPSRTDLADALDSLLRGGRRQGLFADGDGWVSLEHVAHAVSRVTRRTIETEEVRRLVVRTSRFEVVHGHLRTTTARPALRVPDILFAPVPHAARALARTHGRIEGDREGVVHLFSDPDQAWLLAHRYLEHPDVLVVDASRARRAGVRFRGDDHPGTFRSTPIPIRFVLDLRDQYDEQHSAGGVPLRLGTGGQPEVLLVQVTRRSGTTWEVAKGKLEDGESPEAAAVRETREETGLRNPLRVLRPISDVRYGFLAPGGRPRLKTVYLYLMAVDGGDATFDRPADGEGIEGVRWFAPDDAARAVSHPSLVPAMARARDLIGRYGLAPAPGHVPVDAVRRT